MLIGTDFSDYFTEPAKAKAGYKQVFREGMVQDYELAIRHADGHVTPVLYNASLYKDSAGEVEGVFAAARDISERKRAEAEREQFFKFFQSATDLMAIADPNGAFLKTNAQCTETLGYSAAELVAKPFIDFVHPDDKQETLDEMARQQKIGSSMNFENRYVCKDGSFRWLSWRAIFNKDEGLTYATARDVTEQKKAEEALKISKLRLDLAIDASQIGVWELDVINDTSVRNLRHDQIFGYAGGKADWGSKIFFDHIIPEDRPLVQSAFDEAARTDQLVFECRILRPDKSIHWISATGKYVRDGAGNAKKMFGTVTDITERKQLEQQLLESQKMESIGRLAGGVAHDFNNYLTAIKGNIDLATIELPEGNAAQEELVAAGEASDRAAKLAKQLLLFGHREHMELVPTNLNQVINDLIKILGRLIGENYHIITDLADDPNTVNADASHIEQVIMNLVVNARDAMPGGGDIMISTSNEQD